MNELLRVMISGENRIESLKKWLMTKVWTIESDINFDPVKYLEQGENTVKSAEELILRSAYSIYDEIAEKSLEAGQLIPVDGDRFAIVVFDGASIRELPLFENLARQTGYEVIRSDYSFAALPSDTEHFIASRVLPGKKLGPSQLGARREFGEMNLRFQYYDAPTRSFHFDGEKNLFLWSSFPDVTYKDSGSRFSQHFGDMCKLFETVWKNVVLAIPNDYKIIITSDHGYVFFGQGLETASLHHADEILEGNRFKFFSEEESFLNDGNTELQLIPRQRLAMMRGRIKNRVQGPAGNKAYRHGGMSLMEMFTPWLEIRKIQQ